MGGGSPGIVRARAFTGWPQVCVALMAVLALLATDCEGTNRSPSGQEGARCGRFGIGGFPE